MQDLRPYESTYIVTPDLPSEEYAAIVDKFNKLILDNGGQIINQEVWGFRKLAYPIERKLSGYYIFTEFNASPAFIAKLELEYIYDERIIRFLTVSLNKFAVAYNQKRRAKLKGEITEKVS